MIFQARGNGTVFYPSSIEVWSEQLDHRDPGFDPLATAVRAAHARGMKLCAWVNMMPGWVGTEDPGDARQLWHSRQEWFLRDRKGQPPSRKGGKYLGLNPCLPEVRRYLTAICREVVTRYEVDGLQLDYIRFPEPEPVAVGPLGTDSATMALFAEATGRRPMDAAAVQTWQRECVTRLVADVRAATQGGGKKVPLSVAVFADIEVARNKVLQDWPEWCRRGLVDAVVPMNYTADDGLSASRIAGCVGAAGSVPVIAGIGLYKCTSAQQVKAQIDIAIEAGVRGVGAFNYRSLFGATKDVPASVQQELQRGVADWLKSTPSRRW